MQQLTLDDLVHGRQYLIRDRAGRSTEDENHWGYFSGISRTHYGAIPGAIFVNIEPPFVYGYTNGFFRSDLYTFHGENPDTFARREAAIMAHARMTKNITGNPAKPSNYAPLSTNKAPGAPKNRRTRRCRSRSRR